MYQNTGKIKIVISGIPSRMAPLYMANILALIDAFSSGFLSIKGKDRWFKIMSLVKVLSIRNTAFFTGTKTDPVNRRYKASNIAKWPVVQKRPGGSKYLRSRPLISERSMTSYLPYKTTTLTRDSQRRWHEERSMTSHPNLVRFLRSIEPILKYPTFPPYISG